QPGRLGSCDEVSRFIGSWGMTRKTMNREGVIRRILGQFMPGLCARSWLGCILRCVIFLPETTYLPKPYIDQRCPLKSAALLACQWRRRAGVPGNGPGGFADSLLACSPLPSRWRTWLISHNTD